MSDMRRKASRGWRVRELEGVSVGQTTPGVAVCAAVGGVNIMSCSGERIWAELGPIRILLASWTEELSRSGVEFESIERSSAVREEVTLSI